MSWREIRAQKERVQAKAKLISASLCISQLGHVHCDEIDSRQGSKGASTEAVNTKCLRGRLKCPQPTNPGIGDLSKAAVLHVHVATNVSQHMYQFTLASDTNY
jgi:hypothetical protein